MQKKQWPLVIIGLCILFTPFIFINNNKKIPLSDQKIRELQINKKNLPRIAHAGGEYMGASYTDSLEALNANVNKYEIFEIDFNFTSDDELVCIHDWNEYGEYHRKIRTFWKKSLVPPDFKTFERLASEKQKWTNCNLDTLIKWLDDNPGKRIVTDVKGKKNNFKTLADIAKKYPAHIQRFIPQIYKLSEYKSAKSLGYHDIILTFYQMNVDKKKQAFIEIKRKNYDLFAITIPKEIIPKFAKSLKEINIPIYTHTVNDPAELALAKQYGVDEIYTDSLIP